MGRRAHCQIRQLEYGDCKLTDWAQSSALEYLQECGINVMSNEDCNLEDADQWEIEIDSAKIRKAIKNLRKDPSLVQTEESESPRDCGDDLADVLEEGLQAAKKRKYTSIYLDWF